MMLGSFCIHSAKDKGQPLPKFGEWDVNDPASAEGFTVIFNKARDEKKKGGSESPGKAAADPHSRPVLDPGKPQSCLRLLTEDPDQRLGARGASEAAFVPASESPLDTSYFFSRYSWNTSEGLVSHASDADDSSDADSSNGSSGCLSNRHDEVDFLDMKPAYELLENPAFQFLNELA
ncbi:hypothetical protein RIF29_06690 [Crotalaria pallida]|uniref:RIN4 pathogenic type III effector avirulence factor Avr cleavage site domain-containing protein n=1 Tax=Crotalaria pallida TaxID=3830 RepID=A0AAN9PBF8_CROPI